MPGEDSAAQEVAAYRAKVQDLEAALTAQAAELTDATAKVNCARLSLSDSPDHALLMARAVGPSRAPVLLPGVLSIGLIGPMPDT